MAHQPHNRLNDLPDRPANGASHNGKHAEDITAAMAQLRRDLDRDVRGISRQAHQATHWESYVKKFPVAALGIAAVVGYCLVPARRERQYVASPEVVKQLAREGKLNINAGPTPPGRPSMAKQAVLAVGTVAARALMAYAGKRVGEFMSTEPGETVPDA
jgi:ElaB/YqjD/DUF883 family membrane-anchored ribosome-binding protein